MVSSSELRERVAAIFAERDPGLVVWPAPRELGEMPADSEYSHVADPGKCIGARADAWVQALVAGGLATAEPVPQ